MITVSGNLFDITGSVVSGAFVRFQMAGIGNNVPYVAGTALLAPHPEGYIYDFYPNSSGVVSGSLYSTTDVTVAGQTGVIYYIMSIHSLGAPIVSGGVTATGNISINNPPLTSSAPVVNPPTGDTTYLRLDGSNSPVTGSVQFRQLNGQFYVSQYGSLSACVAACGGNRGTVVIDTPITISSNYTVPSYVTLQFQQNSGTVPINVSPGQTLTINGGILAAYPQQLFTGSGTVSFGVQITEAPVEWFGAVGDWNGSTGTDNTTAIQNCLNAMSKGNCLLQSASYKITATLTITKSTVGLVGVAGAITNSSLYPAPAISTIVTTSSTADILDVWGTDATHNISYNTLKNFRAVRSVVPSSTAVGLSLRFLYGTMIDGVTVEDSTVGFYFNGFASQGTGYIENCAVSWGYNGLTETSGNLIGFWLDSRGGVPNNSFRIRNVFVAANPSVLPHSASYTTYGVRIEGTQTNDFHSFHIETATLDYGIWINNTGTALDMVVDDAILDGCNVTPLTIAGVTGGSVIVNGGWQNVVASSTSSGPLTSITGSSHVVVSNVQFYSTASPSGAGIAVSNGGSVRIIGNDITVTNGPAITFSTMRASAIIGNNANGTTATSIISLTSSPSTVVAGNTLNGTATNGILIDSSSAGVQGLETNQIGDGTLGTVTNLISDSSQNKTSVAGTVASLTMSSQTAAISNQALFTPSVSGYYRVTFSAQVTTAATSSSTLGGANGFQVVYKDATSGTTGMTTPATTTTPWINSGNNLNAAASGSVIVNAASGTGVTFYYGYTSSGATPMAFRINVVVERM